MHYFTINLFRKSTSTCFEQAYCLSSGGTFLYVQQLVLFVYDGKHNRMTHTKYLLLLSSKPARNM